MSNKVILEAEVKSNIGDVSKDASELAGELRIMGVSLNDVKAGFTQMAAVAKRSFRTLKVAALSTGIGALVIAIGSLVGYFTQTKKGAELLERAFAGVGAAVKVIVDRVSDFGGGIAKILSGDVRAGLTDMVNSFKGIGTEIKNDTLLMVTYTASLQKLRDSERELNVETAQRRAEIEKLKLIAEDVTRTEEERLAAAEKAFGIEKDLLDKRVENAEEAVRIQQAQMDTSENLEEDLDNLAQKEIELANIRGESFTKQIELNNKINAIKQETINKNNEIKAQNEAELKMAEDLAFELEKLRIKDDHNKAILQNEADKRNRIAAQETLLNRKLTTEEMAVIDDIYNEKYLDLIEKAKTITIDGNKDVVKSAKDTSQAQLAAAAHLTGALASLAGENKALSAASAIISTYAAANGALETGKGTPVAWANAAAIVFQGLANVRKIFAVDVPGGGGGGAGGGGEAQTPAPQMMSGAFELTGGVAPEPLKAFVVTDEMTNSQNQLANIRRRATI